MSTKAAELREMGEKALTLQVSKLESELGELKEAVMTGKEKNHSKMKQLKRDIARTKTVLNSTKLEQ